MCGGAAGLPLHGCSSSRCSRWAHGGRGSSLLARASDPESQQASKTGHHAVAGARPHQMSGAAITSISSDVLVASGVAAATAANDISVQSYPSYGRSLWLPTASTPGSCAHPSHSTPEPRTPHPPQTPITPPTLISHSRTRRPSPRHPLQPLRTAPSPRPPHSSRDRTSGTCRYPRKSSRS